MQYLFYRIFWPSGECSNARQEFFEGKGFYHIVICAKIESLYSISDLTFGSEHDNRRVNTLLSQFFCQNSSFHTRKKAIKNNHVVLFRGGKIIAFDPIV